MKKLLTLSAVMLVASSMYADPVDLQKAKQLAVTLSVEEPVLVSKAVRTESKARKLSAQTQATSPYYVFSRGEGKGFVIVSGDDCLPDILGYTESGDFDEAVLPPHLLGWLDHYKTLIEDAQEAGQNVSRKSPGRKNAPRRIKGLESIPALLTTHWHQTSPYNDRCPVTDKGSRAVTGCVATAASQVIYYYRKDNPDVFQANTPTYGADEWHHTAVTDQIKKGTPIKWDLMLDKYGGSEPAEFKSAVADLVFAVGAMDHMDYYDSSGAQISDLVDPMKTYFNLLSECEYKSDGSSSWVPLATWEKKIYDDLAKGHPIIYTGYKDEETGGHAVVLDGYQSSTGLFHFNFGWGGQGDGWYTVDDETGMNYFNTWQGMTFNVRPRKQNLSASIALEDGFYQNHTNKVVVKVRNNGTLNYSGLYLFCTSGSSKPSALSSASSKDTETVLPNDGGEMELTLTARPTLSRTYTLTLTDASLNVLAQLTVDPQEAASDLRLEGLSVAGSPDKETFEGNDFQVVYNDRSTAIATLSNKANVAYEGTLRMNFYGYDEEAKAWTELGYKTGKVTIGSQETGEASFSILNTSTCPFEVGKYYYGVLANPVPSSEDVIQYAEGTDTIVRFILKESDMEVVGFENDVLTLKGHFDATAFNSTAFAKKATYKTATVYDLTQCSGVTQVAQDVNPNALYYVADDSEATGTNIVKAGKCPLLTLTTGYNFTPRAAFEATGAQMIIGTEPAKWYLLTVPFTATVPDGVVAREITGHSVTGISNKTVDVKTLEAGKTYLVMSSSSNNMMLTGINTQVATTPAENADAAVVGTFVNAKTPADAQLLNDEEAQYFVPVEEGRAVEALRGYWYDETMTKSFRAYANITLDPAYQTLAENIEQAYQILEKYRKVTTADAYKAYLARIHEAEVEFSNREETELTSATKVKNYAAQLLADGDAYKKQILRAENVEIDFTDCIENPSFETKTAKGWTVGKKDGYTSVGAVYNGTAANKYRAVGLDGTYIFQSHIEADNSSVEISQLVEGLTPGYYRLTAMVGTDADAAVTLFAGDSTATVAGHAFGSYYLTEAAIDSIPVVASDGAGTGSLLIGVNAGHWYKVDNFKLTYIASFPGQEVPDAIVEVVAEPKAIVRKGIYTIQGIKVERISAPGIYMVDGKKYLVK